MSLLLRGFWVGLACLPVMLGACASGAAVQGADALPVQRVVLYRNGVGYFERAGDLEGQELSFRVRRQDVGDFLSSLTVIEHTEGGVRSVSFDVPEGRTAPSNRPPSPPVRPMPEEDPPEPEPEDDGDDRVQVKLHLASEGAHDLSVAYVVAAPIWRPAYRVVVDDGEPLLQAWAVVQNTSGADWEDVRLSLTTGAPIAFRSDLGTPVTPRRPLVTDKGEVVYSVPGSQTALEQDDAAGSEEAASAPQGGAARAEKRAAPSRARAEAEESMLDSSMRGAPAPEPAPMTADGMQESVRSMAAVAVLGEGVTRYDVDGEVTVPDGSSTMVAVISKRVPGERAYLYAPDGGVPQSRTHPFQAVRLQNDTGAILERGPISVLGQGTFLGQGVLETLPRGATSFVPFALDQSLVVERSHSVDEADAKLVRITGDQVIVERFRERKTRYALRNGGEEGAKVYLRHERWHGADLVDPPEGTRRTEHDALIPARVAGKGKAKLTVRERTPVTRTVDFMSSAAAEAIGLYLEGAAVEAAKGKALREALELRRQLLEARREARAAKDERASLAQAAKETRDNLEAVKKIETAKDLRARLAARLEELDRRLAELTETIVEAQTRQAELRARLDEALRGISLAASQ